MKNNKKNISYSQCWEDPILLEEALNINPKDKILSIMSGGDNSLALLSMNPESLVSIDINETQKYVLNLKLVAVQYLPYIEILELIGVRESDRRKQLFEKIKNKLPEETILWWLENKDLVEAGVVNTGKFERFLNVFSRYILPLIHSKKTIRKFLNTQNIEEQRKFYKSVWDSKKWRLLFKIVTSRFILKNFARQKGMFTHTNSEEIGKKYLKRLENNFNNVLISNNYFMHYCLIGHYTWFLPMYLEKGRIVNIKKNASKLTTVIGNITDYLKSIPDNSFSKFNLSDVFEPLSIEQNDILWQEIVRTAKPEARVVYWNNLVPRSFPKSLSNHIKNESELSKKLHLKDRIYFYNSFHVHTIIK